MRLKDYGRNRKKRKEYIHQSGLLITGVDVSKAGFIYRHFGRCQVKWVSGVPLCQHIN